MQFRIIKSKAAKQGTLDMPSTIQFIRSVYDKEQTPKPRLVKAKTQDGLEVEVEVPGVRRSKQTLVGSMSYYSSKPTPEETAKLTESEIAELNVFLSALAAQKETKHRSIKIHVVGDAINEAADYILSGDLVTNAQAAEIFEAMSKMSKALKKAGHTKPAKQDPTPALQMNLNEVQMKLE